ncbi:exo-alpha-sialidase [Mucilaginibacter sp. RS28]|uniref:Exo-alpha-sialidase n=1 Tax=Mucilaginibacter straminoryzae TaxID=2932774 RepID=A0A9X1X6F7_9SPHI|nr:sialidase family protein [Mucilaginibacter straminoryzae]MCJ8211205.1 exo-alpha-sialidase [Mucilaginibacter straminoryzae]
MKNAKMKKLFVLAPAVILVLLLLNSFMVKEKETKITSDDKSGPLNIVFRSADGGQTWQNISKGLPEHLQKEGISNHNVFANERGLYLRAGNGFYHSEPYSATTFWEKETFPGNQREIAPGNNGIFAYNFRGQFLQKTNGSSDWSPRYTNFQKQAIQLNKTADWMSKNYNEKQVSSVFETTGGTVFIGSNNALYRSANHGKTWQYVHVSGWILKMAEANGVLMAASTQGILRSTDNGQTWASVIGESGAGVTVERIDGGFAAIAYNTITHTNTIYISQDSGKTWSDAGEGLQFSTGSPLLKQLFDPQPSLYISSIEQVGKYLMCGSSAGIFRSVDMGKTWEKLPLSSIENKGFSLYAAGNVIYAISNKGC